MQFRAHIDVKPKSEIADPAGQTVERALPGIGIAGITAVRVGKRIDLIVEAPSRDAASTIVSNACEKLLVNPIIEEFEAHLDQAPLEPAASKGIQ